MALYICRRETCSESGSAGSHSAQAPVGPDAAASLHACNSKPQAPSHRDKGIAPVAWTASLQFARRAETKT